MADDRIRAFRLMGRTKFNRDLVTVCALANQLYNALEVLAEHGSETVCHELTALGLPSALLAREDAEYLLKEVDDVNTDTNGFMWVLNTFLNHVESHKVSPRDEGDAAPCAVVGGKAVG